MIYFLDFGDFIHSLLLWLVSDPYNFISQLLLISLIFDQLKVFATNTVCFADKDPAQRVSARSYKVNSFDLQLIGSGWRQNLA